MIKNRVDADTKEFQQKLADEVTSILIDLGDKVKRNEVSQERYKFDKYMLGKQTKEQVENYRNEAITKEINALTKVETRIMSEEEYAILKKNKTLKSRIVQESRFFRNRVKVIVSVGNDTFLYEANLPGVNYPIVPFPYLHTATPYPVGAAQMAVGTQQQINKANQLMIHNASLGSSLRYLVEEGTIDEEIWEKYSAMPGAFLKWKRQNQESKPPIAVPPMNLPSAFYDIGREADADMSELLGARPQLSGGASETETYRGLLAMDEFSTRRIRSWMTNVVEPALERVGQVYTEYCQAIYKAEKIFRIVSPDTGEYEEHKINVPIYADLGKQVGRYHDYQSTRFDVKIVSGGTLPSNRWAKLEEYTKWFQAGIIDDIAFIAETDIKNKQQLIERNSRYSQMQGQINAQEEQLKQQKGTIETYQRELEHAGIKDKVSVAENEIVRRVAEFKANLKSTEEKQKAVSRAAISNLNTEIDAAKKINIAKLNKNDAKPKK